MFNVPLSPCDAVPWNMNMEPENHQFGQENHLNQTCFIFVFQINFPWGASGSFVSHGCLLKLCNTWYRQAYLAVFREWPNLVATFCRLQPKWSSSIHSCQNLCKNVGFWKVGSWFLPYMMCSLSCFGCLLEVFLCISTITTLKQQSKIEVLPMSRRCRVQRHGRSFINARCVWQSDITDRRWELNEYHFWGLNSYITSRKPTKSIPLWLKKHDLQKMSFGRRYVLTMDRCPVVRALSLFSTDGGATSQGWGFHSNSRNWRFHCLRTNAMHKVIVQAVCNKQLYNCPLQTIYYTVHVLL